jgi:hypothetical protein
VSFRCKKIRYHLCLVNRRASQRPSQELKGCPGQLNLVATGLAVIGAEYACLARLRLILFHCQCMPLHDQKQTHTAPIAQGVPATSSKGASRLSRYVLPDSHVEHDALVESELLPAFVTGIQDAVSFSDFHCYQTGNAVVLATVVTGLIGDLVPLSNIGMSLAMLLAGGSIMG